MKCERLYDTVIVSRGWRSVLSVQTLTSGNPTLISCAEPVHVLAGRDNEIFFFNFIVECFVGRSGWFTLLAKTASVTTWESICGTF